MVFKRLHLAKLRKRIADEKKAGSLKTPKDQPVKVELNLNRLPCPNCSSILAELAGMYPELKFVVKASSASNKASQAITIEYIEKMLNAGVEVSTLGIYGAIMKKIEEIVRASKAKQIKPITANEYYLVEAALPRIRDNLSREKKLQEMIDEARKRIAAKKEIEKVPPQGS